MTDIGDFTHVQRQFSTYQMHVIEQDGGLIIQVLKPEEGPVRPPYCPENWDSSYPCPEGDCEENCASGDCPNMRCHATFTKACFAGHSGLCHYILGNSWCEDMGPPGMYCWCTYVYSYDTCEPVV